MPLSLCDVADKACVIDGLVGDGGLTLESHAKGEAGSVTGRGALPCNLGADTTSKRHKEPLYCKRQLLYLFYWLNIEIEILAITCSYFEYAILVPAFPAPKWQN